MLAPIWGSPHPISRTHMEPAESDPLPPRLEHGALGFRELLPPGAAAVWYGLLGAKCEPTIQPC